MVINEVFCAFTGFTSIGASSEACDNYRNGRVVDTLWYHNMMRGVSILPIQHLALDKWVTFNNLPSNLNPLYTTIGVDLDAHSDQSIVHILLETNIYPDLSAIEKGANIVSVSFHLANYVWLCARKLKKMCVKNDKESL